jgi:hypothetical protein
VNCLDFRRRWLTVPGARDLALAQHERVCPGCRQVARRASLFEHRLREALIIEAPPGLAERIKRRRDIAEQVRSRQLRPLRYALAASLCLLLGFVTLLAYGFLVANPNQTEPHRALIRHVSGEIGYLYSRSEVPPAQVKGLLARFGAQMHGGIGEVRFAASCLIRRHRGVHLVLKGRQGPVNVLYVDGAYVEDRSSIHGGQWEGLIFPVTRGSVAVLGERKEAIGAIVTRLRHQVRWGV